MTTRSKSREAPSLPLDLDPRGSEVPVRAGGTRRVTVEPDPLGGGYVVFDADRRRLFGRTFVTPAEAEGYLLEANRRSGGVRWVLRRRTRQRRAGASNRQLSLF